VPLLTAVPVVNILANLIFCQTVPLLNLTFELFSAAVYNVKIVVSELSPLLLDPAFNLSPISFDSIPVHVNRHRSAPDMIGSEHLGSIMVPYAVAGTRICETLTVKRCKKSSKPFWREWVIGLVLGYLVVLRYQVLERRLWRQDPDWWT
jgi:hypothetical protein